MKTTNPFRMSVRTSASVRRQNSTGRSAGTIGLMIDDTYFNTIELRMSCKDCLSSSVEYERMTTNA